jgi:hypothetical protein
VPKLTLRGRISQTREDENRRCRERAQRFRELKDYLEEMHIDPSADLMKDIENVIQHSLDRANLGKNHFARFQYVLSQYPAYDRYWNGLRTMLKDIFQS